MADVQSIMKEKTVCFTGHRKIPMHEAGYIKRKLRETVIALINEGYTYFGAGGALGFDTLAAECVLDLKKEYAEIKLILVLPCVTQARSWSEKDIKKYEEIKRLADKVVYISEEYTYDCMHKRNRHLVNSSSVCICYLAENKGGTLYTVNYAAQNRLRIINLSE